MILKVSRRNFIGSALALAATPAIGAVPAPSPTALRMQRLSWAGVRLEAAETSLLIDPWTNTASFGGSWPREVVQPAASAKRKSVLITHIHNDHFDAALIKQLLAEGGAVFCLDEVAAFVASKGIVVRPVAMFRPETFGEFTFTPVPASDGFGDVQQVSWIVRGAGTTLLHGGDTIWHPRFELYGRAYGPFDVAFLPINGVTIAGSVDIPKTLTPAQAVAAATLLRAKLLVPIHYGVSDDSYHEAADVAAETTRLAAAKGAALKIVPEGGWITSP